jgi:muconolactone delta-isomerase
MKILALERELPNIPAAAFTPYAAAEARRVWQLVQDSVIRETYFRQDRSAAVLVLECADTDEAEAILHTLPMVKAGLITFEIIPLVAYPGFARLFAAAE